VRVRHLATHTAGLPGTVTDPEAALRWPALAAAVRRAGPLPAPGTAYRYSNLGVATLGALLARRAGTTYAGLVADRVTGPLGVADLALDLDVAQRRRLAPGFGADGAPVSTPTIPTGAPAGGFYGSVGDLLVFVRAQLGQGPAELAAAAGLATRCHFDDGGGTRMGLCWHLGRLPGSGVGYAWHNGSLPGYHGYLGIAPRARAGVVILANVSRTSNALDDAGRRMLASLAAAAPRPVA
jgi:CubicO group peptidase (beta-lactamase class C family)